MKSLQNDIIYSNDGARSGTPPKNRRIHGQPHARKTKPKRFMCRSMSRPFDPPLNSRRLLMDFSPRSDDLSQKRRPRNVNKMRSNLNVLNHRHGVWKSQKKSHSTLRAKRATFTFWADKSWLKIAKNGLIWRVFENLKLAVKQCYQTGHF